MKMKENDFVSGVNYWPQRTAMFMWREFDKDPIDQDMAIISDLGFSCVSISLLWEDFQPKPKSVPAVMLDRLVEFLEVANGRDLEVMVGLFAGHICGLNWLPPWMLLASTSPGQYKVFSLDKIRPNKLRNPYADSEVIEAQIFFLNELLNAVSGHPALNSWNLGNEPSLWAIPPDKLSAELWLQVMTETLKEKDNTLPVTLGLRVKALTESGGLTLGLAAKYLDYIAIHVHQNHTPWSKDPCDAAIHCFLGCIARWLVRSPVLIQELGLATKPRLPEGGDRDLEGEVEPFLVSEEDAAQFAENVLNHLRRFSLKGAFWKSYGDYHPSIWEWPPLDTSIRERFCGLVRYDGTLKPAAFAFKFRPTEPVEIGDSDEWLDLSVEKYYLNPHQHLARLYRRFREYYSLR